MTPLITRDGRGCPLRWTRPPLPQLPPRRAAGPRSRSPPAASRAGAGEREARPRVAATKVRVAPTKAPAASTKPRAAPTKAPVASTQGSRRGDVASRHADEGPHRADEGSRRVDTGLRRADEESASARARCHHGCRRGRGRRGSPASPAPATTRRSSRAAWQLFWQHDPRQRGASGVHSTTCDFKSGGSNPPSPVIT